MTPRRIRLLALAGLTAGALAAAPPATASAGGLEDAMTCTQGAYAAWDPSSTTSTTRMVLVVEGCWERFASWFATEEHQRQFVMCLDDAIDAYQPIRGIEPTLAIGVYCVETYLGYDIAIEAPPLASPTQQSQRKRKRVQRRRATRSHRATRS